MSIEEKRRSIRHLLDEHHPADGIATYFAFYYAEEKTNLVTVPDDGVRANGYVSLSRTGMDLFRPFVTMRLPLHDLEMATTLIYKAIPVGTAVILNIPPDHYPIIEALFDIHSEETLKLYMLPQGQFQPIINVLITQDIGANGYPRFLIRANDEKTRPVGAVAGLNWMSDQFAEISVNTAPGYRRRGWGKSVVSAMVNYVLENGRTPLYAVSEENEASIQLAEAAGFVYSGVQQFIIQAVLSPKP